jgi:hypothetical protein
VQSGKEPCAERVSSTHGINFRDRVTRAETAFRNVRVASAFCKIAVMKDSSRIKRRVDVPSSDKWWAEHQLLRDLELKECPKIADVAVFAERIRTSWKSFMWPRPSSPSQSDKADLGFELAKGASSG